MGTVFVGDGVELRAGRELADEEHPRARGIGQAGNVLVAIGGVGAEEFAVVAGGDAEGVGHLVVHGEDVEQRVFPPEERAGELSEARDDGSAVVVPGDALDEPLLQWREL